MKKNILLNPGPVNISERVRKALLQPDLCHREPEFFEIQNNIRSNLLKIYNLQENKWASILLTGSGTAAVEAMLTSIVSDTDRVLILENGVYGERISKIAEIYHLPHSRLHHAWDEPIDINKLDDVLNQEKITHLALVHHETTTGRLNNLDEIAKICSQHNISLLLDGVSSFGAETLDFENWNIAACAGTANKCLHGIPGVSFVIVNRKPLAHGPSVPRTLYLDLKNYLQQQDNNGTPFTQSVQSFYGLDEALKEMQEEGGWQERQKSYRQRMKIIRTGLQSLNIKPLLDENACSCVLHAFHLPENITYQVLHDQLKADGYVIYSGQGNFVKSIFRVSAMGNIPTEDINRFVSTMKNIVKNYNN